MLIVMNHSATDDDIREIKNTVSALGLKPVIIPGGERTAIGVIGNKGWVDDAPFAGLSAIQEIIHVTKPYKLVSRDFHPLDSVIDLGEGVSIGGNKGLIIIAGPCAIESRDQLLRTAEFLKSLGVPLLRGGAFKPRTSPHSFQGMREEGIQILAEVRAQTGILTVTEVMSPEHLDYVARHVDVLQIGARNMQNYDLLREAGRSRKPVILKRGLSATVEEWLSSAEYVLLEGNPNVILCERGIRTFETATRNTSDLAVIPLVKRISHLPVIFDPSHATGNRTLVPTMALASVVAGVHGVMIEIHPLPEQALSDGPQSLHFEEFEKLTALMNRLREWVDVSGL
ncbi:MAG: 3-deoxy-7-phosphoheptulonate synthase [Thermodesulfovibrionales bacterium]